MNKGMHLGVILVVLPLAIGLAVAQRFGEKATIEFESLFPGASGRLHFLTGSQEGFEFAVDVKGLLPNHAYGVFVLQWENWSPTTPPEQWIFVVQKQLGDIMTNEEGEAELEGVHELAPGSYTYELIVFSPTRGTEVRTPGTNFAQFTIVPG